MEDAAILSRSYERTLRTRPSCVAETLGSAFGRRATPCAQCGHSLGSAAPWGLGAVGPGSGVTQPQCSASSSLQKVFLKLPLRTSLPTVSKGVSTLFRLACSVLACAQREARSFQSSWAPGRPLPGPLCSEEPAQPHRAHRRGR